jgi:hypothetical protein
MTLDLRGHFTEFRAAQPGRIHLAAHSHHFWPDAACEAHRRALADAARLADNKWDGMSAPKMVITTCQRPMKSFPPTWQHHRLMIAFTVVPIIQ